MYGCTEQKNGYSPGFRSVVTISLESPALIMLVSNSFPILGSVASLPFVTVCGVESPFSTAIVSPAFTVIGSGSYDGFPCTDAPCGIFRVAAAAVAAGAEAPVSLEPPPYAGPPPTDAA